MSFLKILSMMTLLCGGAWVGQVILFWDRRGPFNYGWKGFCGAALWLFIVIWAGIKILGL
jgi:hypothetical protein